MYKHPPLTFKIMDPMGNEIPNPWEQSLDMTPEKLHAFCRKMADQYDDTIELQWGYNLVFGWDVDSIVKFPPRTY